MVGSAVIASTDENALSAWWPLDEKRDVHAKLLRKIRAYLRDARETTRGDADMTKIIQNRLVGNCLSWTGCGL